MVQIGTITPHMTDVLPLNVHTWGPETGARVLLVHGIQSSGATWWRIAEGLAARGARVAAPDLRGHGTSPRGDRHRLADFIADLRALGTDWDLVVGHSLGGTLTALALADDPGWAGRAVLLDPVLVLPEEDFEAIVAGQLRELRTTTEAALESAHPHWHPEDRRLKAEAVRQVDPRAAENGLRDNRPWDHAHVLNRITTPLTILVPSGDDAMFALDDPRAIVIAGTGHSLHRDAPDRVLEALL
jgi:pimeloyl-ACP methyl ester carboxylesterase